MALTQRRGRAARRAESLAIAVRPAMKGSPWSPFPRRVIRRAIAVPRRPCTNRFVARGQLEVLVGFLRLGSQVGERRDRHGLAIRSLQLNLAAFDLEHNPAVGVPRNQTRAGSGSEFLSRVQLRVFRSGPPADQTRSIRVQYRRENCTLLRAAWWVRFGAKVEPARRRWVLWLHRARTAPGGMKTDAR